MRFVTLLNEYNEPVAVNTELVSTIVEDPVHDGVIIRMTDKSEIIIPLTKIHEVVAKLNLETKSDLGKMTDALCQRISHLEERMEAGLQYVGRSVH